MAMNDASKIGLSNRFLVSMSGKEEYNLGSWTKADGLDVAWDVAEYRMGDGGNDRLYFPGNTKYNPVKLSRGVTAETDTVKKWLSSNSFHMDHFAANISRIASAATYIAESPLRDV